MGYIKAEEVLPAEVIELIQQYVDGANMFPKSPIIMLVGDRQIIQKKKYKRGIMTYIRNTFKE